MMIRSARLAAAAVLLMLSSHVTAEVVTLVADRDNTIYDDSPDLSNGVGDYIFAGQTDNGRLRRALVRFDVAGALPAGATVNSATLTLYMSRSQVGGRDVTAYRLTADWGEGNSNAPGEEGEGTQAAPGDATWQYRFYTTAEWTSQGGDYAGTASATTSVSNNGFYDWSSSALTADVQAWVDAPAMNFGWCMKGEENGQSAKRFQSRENSRASRRPTLVVDFTPPAQAGACCFSNGSCLLLTSAGCATQGGVYEGNGTACTPNPCPPPASGACCFDDTTCSVLSESQCTAQGGTYQGGGAACTPGLCPLVLEPFVDPLPRPAVAVPVSGMSGGVAEYDLAMTELGQQLHRDLPATVVWGYGGSYPGPTIEASTGMPVTVNWINDLRDLNTGQLRTEHYFPIDECLHGPRTTGQSPVTVVHLHGGHVPAEVDGYPEHTFLPGNQVQYVYPNNQDATTAWYHDHALGITRLNVMMGLAGFYLIRDDFERALPLPVGDHEIPLVIQDRSFLADGSWDYPELWEDHFFGDVVLVNGKVWPFLEVERGKYRFRILNGSNSRAYRLSLSNGATFFQIGSEGGLLPAPVPFTELTLAGGERADVIMDFEPYPAGTEIILENDAPAPFPGEPGVGVIPNVMKFVVLPDLGDTRPVPVTLRPRTPLLEQDATQFREFQLRRANDACTGIVWLINDLGWDDITEFPEIGDTEVWSFINRSVSMHPMHMHLVFFEVLDRQAFDVVGGQVVPIGPVIPPEPNETGGKDTVRVNPNEITRVIARFEDYLGLFAYHCHILEHEDHEMMRQFHVVPPCPSDIDGDRMVTVLDMLVVLGEWGPCPGGCPGDVTGDELVNIFDLLQVLADWGDCPEQ